MLKWAIIFAIISLVAGVFGFTGVAAGAAGIAKIQSASRRGRPPKHQPKCLPCAGIFHAGWPQSPRAVSASVWLKPGLAR